MASPLLINAHHLPPLLFQWTILCLFGVYMILKPEVVHWRRNIFPTPYGIAEVRVKIDSSAVESIALKAITVMSILLLQKPAAIQSQRITRPALSDM